MVKSASIVILTFNREEVIEKTLKAMLKQDYPEYEVIVVNDGSKDNTKEILKKFKDKKLTVINNEKEKGPCKARNQGIKKAKNDFIIIMDDDCIPERNWLKKMMQGFDSDKVGMVSGYSIHGGTSTAFSRKALKKVGLYDEEYFYYREDTDLVFRIMDAGFQIKQVKAKYVHEHKIEKPKNLLEFLRHSIKRVKNHKNDVLLYKKNPERTKKFLDIKLGFIVNPLNDFKTATGLWHEKGKMNLSSPRGIIFLENKSLIHSIIILFGGILYVIAVKTARLYGSIKFRKLLI
jgi:glycosyltransferase involved in cell wall biosynthesis